MRAELVYKHPAQYKTHKIARTKMEQDPLILAIDIGGTQFALALAEPSGRILKQKRGRTERSGGAEWMIERLLKKARALVMPERGRVQACGIGFGGPVDFAAQRVLSSTHVPGWENVALPALIERELDLPTVLDNDANTGGLGDTPSGPDAATAIWSTIPSAQVSVGASS